MNTSSLNQFVKNLEEIGYWITVNKGFIQNNTEKVLYQSNLYFSKKRKSPSSFTNLLILCQTTCSSVIGICCAELYEVRRMHETEEGTKLAKTVPASGPATGVFWRDHSGFSKGRVENKDFHITVDKLGIQVCI